MGDSREEEIAKRGCVILRMAASCSPRTPGTSLTRALPLSGSHKWGKQKSRER